jgi:hypothetical protein
MLSLPPETPAQMRSPSCIILKSATARRRLLSTCFILPFPDFFYLLPYILRFLRIVLPGGAHVFESRKTGASAAEPRIGLRRKVQARLAGFEQHSERFSVKARTVVYNVDFGFGKYFVRRKSEA